MERTGWKILFTIICLIVAGGVMFGFRNVAASETEKPSEASETEATSAETEAVVREEGPLIEWKMEETGSWEGISYYRQDNCGLSVTISDAASDLVLAEVKIGDAGFSLDDFETTESNTCIFALTAEELSDLITDDGEVTAYVYVEEENGSVAEDALTFILDRTSPEYTLSFEDPSGEETAEGEIAFYGSSHERLRAVYTIKEDYFAPALFGADGVRADLTANPLRAAVKAKKITGGKGYTGAQTYVVETDEGTEGIYRFGISGSDLAGNPLIMSKSEAQKDGYRKSIYEEGCGYWTTPKVLDHTKPSLEFVVSGPKDYIFYRGMTSGQDVSVLTYEPFQQCERAKLMILAKDEMACRIDYQVKSSLHGTISQRSDAARQFLSENAVTETLAGQQWFRIDWIEARDRSGNVTRIGRSNTLFLDHESPTAVIRAPEPVVFATDEITHRKADGRGLYNDDVTLQVTVTDTKDNVPGCGLGNVSCKVLVNGEEIGTGMTDTDVLSDCLNDAPDILWPDEIVYGDDSAFTDLQASYTGSITIPKGDAFETNDIEVLVYATDCAGNGTGEVLAKFLLGMDSKGPEVTVSFDNNAAENEQYFKEPRNARIQVFDRNVDTGRIVINTQSTEISGMVYGSGDAPAGDDDCYEKTIRYDQDGTYTLAISGTDALGNAFAKEVLFTGASPKRFVIDQTAPVILVEQVEAGNACNGTVAPVIRFQDDNFSKDQTELSLVGSREGDRKDLLSPITEEETGGRCVMRDIPVKKENDDIYTLMAKQTDLAGNESHTEIEFSVNRFGSTYDYNNDRSTQDLMRDYYTGQEKNIYLREINLNRLTDQKVTLYHDGSNKILQRGIDYRVRQEAYGESMQYIYAISRHNFKNEGIYEVIVQSVDAAGNINSNHVMRQDDGIESVRIRFAVDKTAPQILFNGTDATKEPAFSEGEEIQILPGDNMQLEKVEMSLDGQGEAEGTVLETYSGTGLLQKIVQTEGMLSFTFDERNKEQCLVVRAVDAAGNESVGTASCMKKEEMQKAGIFAPAASTEEGKEEDAESRFGIPVVLAGLGLLLLLGRKKRRCA